MYYLVDLKEQKTEVFKTKLDLLYYRFSKPEHGPLWYNPNETIPRMMDFLELNMTGKDTVTGMEKVPGKFWFYQGTTFPCYEEVATLRRYMVTDEQGRSIDIRTWLPEIALVKSGKYRPTHKKANAKEPVYRREPCGQGRKQHSHRVGYPAMWHRALAETLNEEDLALDAEVRPTRDHSGIRKRGIKDETSFERAERRASRSWTCSKCWKDQSKAGRQWAKHKKAQNSRFLRGSIDNSPMLYAHPEFLDDDCWVQFLMMELLTTCCGEV